MINTDALLKQETLTDGYVRLEQLSGEYFPQFWPGFNDPDGRWLTGTHDEFTEEQIRDWLQTRPGQPDRADWVILRAADGVAVGEAVLNDLDVANESISFRIGLTESAYFGQGYGSAATRLVVDYAFVRVGVHRLELSVYAFNPRAQRVYEKCGFRREGIRRDALRWDGKWYDSIEMSILATDR